MCSKTPKQPRVEPFSHLAARSQTRLANALSRVEGVTVAGVPGDPVPLAGVGVAEGPGGSGRVWRGHAGPGSATGGGLG